MDWSDKPVIKMKLPFPISFCLCYALFAGTAAYSQESEYKMEAGVMTGVSFYMGDANSSHLYRNTEALFGAVSRYNINPRFALKCNLAVARISGDTRNMTGSVFPGGQAKFERSIYDFGIQAESNFFAFGTTLFNNSKRFSPYYLAGIGVTYAPKPLENVIAVNFPIGLGVKYALTETINIGFEWTIRFSSSDKLDVTADNLIGPDLEDPFQIKGKGMKNKDSYSFSAVFITFDLFKRSCNCNKE